MVLLEAALCGARASGVNYGGVRRQGRGLEQMPLARRAHELWGQLPQLIGIDGEYVRSGHLKLACSDADLQALHAYRAQTRGFGMNLEMLDRTALARRFGWLGAQVVGGSFCPEAVSYTHLDVYKRQGLRHGDSVQLSLRPEKLVPVPAGQGKLCLLYTSTCAWAR